MNLRNVTAILLAGLVLLCAAPAMHEPASARELSMREARRAIASGNAVPFRFVLRRVKRRYPGEILRAGMMSRPNGRLIYRIKVLTYGGNVRVVIVDAVTGEILRVR